MQRLFSTALFWLVLFQLPGAMAQPASTPATKPAAAEIHSKVDKIFEGFNSTVSPGCALAVIQDGRVTYTRGYGMANLDHDIPIRPDSVFHVASISKQFTDAAVILLAQEGKLSLDDDIRQYVPELPDFGAKITLRHLVHHTSGLRDQWSLLSLAGWRYSLDLITDQDVLDVMASQKGLNFAPGKKHTYCNTGYTLLAQVVARVSGKSFREFTSERIFQPLGMKSTHFRDDHAEVVKHIAYGYERGKGENEFKLSVTNFDTAGATSLLTTVEDLALWDQNFYTPKVGGPTLIAQMLQKGRLNSGKEIDYAFGLVHGKYRGLTTIDHGGADAGYRADLLRFPDQHFSVACLCNLAESGPGQLARKVAEVYLANQMSAPEAGASPSGQPVTLTADQLAPLTGLYWRKEEETGLRIQMKDAKLHVSFGPDDDHELGSLSPNRFRLAAFSLSVNFERKADSGTYTVTLRGDGQQEGETYEAAREFKPGAGELAMFAGVYRSEEIEPVYRIVLEKGELSFRRLNLKRAVSRGHRRADQCFQ